jgi:type IV secretion system protein VirB9
MNRVLISTLLWLPVLAGTSFAQTAGVREVAADERAIVSLSTEVRYFTTIVLPEDEDVVEAYCGDPMFWTVEAAGNTAYVKPAKEHAATNLEIRSTSGTLYSFQLREVSGTKLEPDRKVFVRASAKRTNPRPKFVSAAQMEATQTQLAQAREALEAEQRRATEAIAAHKAEYATRLRFDYRWKDAKTVRIGAMWHDGQATYLQVEARELPALYETVDGKPSLTNYRVEGKTYIVPKVLEHGYLTLGDTRVTFEPRR